MLTSKTNPIYIYKTLCTLQFFGEETLNYVVARVNDLNIEDDGTSAHTSGKYSEPQLEQIAKDFEEPLAKLRASMRLEEGKTDLFILVVLVG